VSAVAASTTNPVQFDFNGIGWRLNTSGRFIPVGGGTLDYTGLANFPTACANQFARQIAATAGCAQRKGQRGR
jgi:hypothetical protein